LVHNSVIESPNLIVNVLVSGEFVDERLSSVSSAGAVLLAAELKLNARWKQLCAMADNAEHGQGCYEEREKLQGRRGTSVGYQCGYIRFVLIGGENKPQNMGV
jgi:hypothetical protein